MLGDVVKSPVRAPSVGPVSGSAGGSPPPTGPFFLATFDAPDETAISAYSPNNPAGGYAGSNVTGAWWISGNAFASESRVQATGLADYVAWDLGATPPTEYTISADIRVFGATSNSGIGVMLCSPDGSIQSDDCYFFNFYNQDLYLDQRSGGSYGANLGTDTSVSVTAGQLYELKVEVTPTRLVCYLDDVEIFDVANAARRGRYFGFMTYVNNNSGVAANAPLMDNLTVTVPE